MARKTSQSDKEYMNQSTSFAQVATNLLTVLQGYTKGIRLLLVMFVALTVTTNAWGAEEIVYTLTPAEGSNNSYAGNCDIVIDGVTWNLTGNSQEQPWRIGGKSLTKVDRAIYNKTPISNNISKITIQHGTASSITVNSVKLVVSTQANGTGTVISELTSSFAASSTMTFTRPDGKDWTNAYYKIIYNVTVTNNSNKYLQFTNALFYSAGGNTPDPIDPEITFLDGEYTVGGAALDLSTLWSSNSTGDVTYSVTDAGTTGATIEGSTFTATAAGICTVQASQEATATHNAATATATITVTAPAGGGGGEGDCIWTLVTNTSNLAVGDEIVIAAKDYNYALSTTQNNNNRGQASITKNNSNITFGNDVQIFTLLNGKTSGTFAFQDNDGINNEYLYAASSSNNYLKTESTLSANSSWEITIASDGTATIVAQGSYTRNTMQYNQSSCIFACYGSASQKALAIYKEVCTGGTTQTSYAVTIDSNIENGTVTANPTPATAGTEIVLTATPNKGYQFSSWTVTKEGGGTVEVTNNIFTMPASNVIVSATFVTIPQLATPTNLQVTNISCNEVTLSWDAVTNISSYTVAYRDSKYTNTKTKIYTNTTTVPVAPGTTYAWTVQAIGNGTTYADSQIANGNSFTTNYKITYDVNGGSWTACADGCVAGGEDFTICSTVPTQTGYDFMGWSTANDETAEYQASATITNVSETITLYAVWKQKTYTITWMANGQEFHKQQDATHGTNLAVPSAPDPETYACDDKVFVGWTATQISGTTNDEPDDLFTTKTAKVQNAANTYYAVFATVEGGGETAELVKMTAGDDFNIGDKIVIIAEGTRYGLYQKTSTSNYIDYWTTQATNGAPTLEEIAEDSKKYVEVSAGTATGTIKLGDATNGYLYNSSSTDMSLSTNSSSDWSIIAWTDNTFTFKAGQYLSCRTDLSSTNKNKWRGAGANCDCETGTNCSGVIYYNVYKYISGSTASYSDYSTTCVKLPDPVLSFATEPANPIEFTDAVCGGNSSKQSVTVVGENLRDNVEVSVTGPYKIARTNSANLKDFTTSLTLDKTNAGTIHSNYQTVYIISTPPAQSTEATTGTLTFTTTKGNTLTVNLSTPTVTCTQYTLTLVDRGVSTEQPTKYYAGETIDEAPADPEGVCTDPIHYVFDGWAEATVAEGSTAYTKLTFPYTVTGNTKFYAVYRYLDDGGEPSNDFIKVTKEKDDWTGDYVIINEDEEEAIGNAYQNTNTLTAVDVTIQDNKVVSPSEAVIWQIRKHGENYTMYNASANNYAYIAKNDAKGAGLSATTTNTTQDIQIVFNNGTAKVSGVNIYRCFYYYGSNTEWRTYATGSYNTGALYCRSLESYLYTSSPVCGPHLVITEGKDIYVTGGNAGGTRDLVIAQQKVSYKATRLNVGPDDQVPDVKVAPNGITVSGVVTTNVQVTIEQYKEKQADGTYTITGDIVVTYKPILNGVYENIDVKLAVDYNSEASDNFTVHARSLPAGFVIVAKSGDKWYALNGDMANGSSANPANGQVTLNDDANPTQVTYAPCNTIYTFDGIPNTGDRTRVRFQGTDGAWLWAASGTNVGIQNKSLKEIPEGNNKAYNWKLETDDNITYKFHNDNNSRLLGLSGEKFGMYANAVQEFRILPYEAKCLYNYAPTNLKVSVLKGTYVTLTWDAVAGATKYQYSTNGTAWTDADTEPTATINGLTGDTEYTYYIRAYHEDAGVSQECIDYAEITFTTADCDDVPTDITYTADLNSITVSWTAAASTATIKLYLDENGEHAIFTQNGTTSPWKISTLSQNTTYYLQIFSGGTCASPIVPVKTEDVEVDIVEWQPQGIIVDINTDETIGVTLENEVSYGSNVGAEATELFFSKYYEASYNVKLVAIYNGTKNIIDLTDYIIKYGKTSWESNFITLKDFGATKGQIQPGEEIILYSYTENNADDKKILDCVHEAFPDGNWVRVTNNNNTGKGILAFGGDKTLALFKGADIIDIIGAVNGSIPNNSKANEKPAWGDAYGWICATGLSLADDSEIGISTNRCLLVRNNTVTSGANAVASNTTDFVTLCSEWKGAHVLDSDVDNGIKESCENFAYIGTFDYSDYYTKYEPMGEGTTFDENARNTDGTVTIPITDLYKHACSNIRVKLTNSNGEVLSDREYKVPIMITTSQGTDGQTFLDLQQNLATVEVDGEGNVIKTYPLSLDAVREICKTCDVVIRDNATLTKVTDGTTNDHPQVHDVIVYEGASIIIPDGTDHNYTINSLSLRRKGDDVASAQVQGTGKFVLPTEVPVTLSMRIDANNWHWFTLPYDCDIADVTWSDGTEAKYNTDWFLMYYDGESRSNQKSNYESHWKVYNGTTIEAGKGYIIGITGDLTHPDYTFELRFPMAQEVLTAEQTDKTVAVNAWGVKKDIRPNHKGWNLVGNPYMDYYQPSTNGFAGLPLIKYADTYDPNTGLWDYEESGNVPFLVIPQDGGWSEYKQELASDVQMMPFTAYFVQVGDPANDSHSDGMELKASFEADKRGRSSLIRRAPSEVDELENPAIVAVSLTNAKGESDKTTLLIADRFNNEYEMNADFFKWFGDYYTYYTKPVLYTIGADNESRAFNALNEELAAQPVALGMYAAQAGEYTFSLHLRSDLGRVEEVWLHDAISDTHTNLMLENYTFSTNQTYGSGRFSLSVKMMPKIATSIDNIEPGTIWATAKDNEVIVNGLNGSLQLWLYDAVGKLLYAEPTTNYQHRYTVPQDGVYFITVKDVAQVRTIKVVVE